MKIDALIHRDIISICVTEEINHVKRLLKKSSYLLVLNQKMTPIGIVTMHDLDKHPNVELKDLDLDKPGVKIQASIRQVLEVMQVLGEEFLPVYQCQRIIGVITLSAVKNALTFNLMTGSAITPKQGRT